MPTPTLAPTAETIAARRLDDARRELMSAIRQLDAPKTRGAHATVAAAVSCVDDALSDLAGEQG